MKFSERWLRERVNLNIATEQLFERFTMAGLEIDAVEAVAHPFSNVVVGLVKSVEKHPDAEKLSVCMVNAGDENDLQIVCGASNVKANAKVALALIGATLNDKLTIKKSTLRGVESYGMLCSLVELGLAETSNGIFILPDEAIVGQDLREYLQLDDVAIEMDLTPNRGDCLAVEGIAREAAALCGADYHALSIEKVKPQNDSCFDVEIIASEDCPHYGGRVILDINMNAVTPLWMKERLRRSGIRSIDPVVDVTNYVMIELGQPLHAFDLDTLHNKIVIRKAKEKEPITLLDGQQLELDEDVLVIADQKGPLAIAGVMGGAASGVSSNTRNIFLESAFFTPHLMAGKARRYGLHTDSSHRFERGVDVKLQMVAIERATQLLLEMVGGSPGPVIEKTEAAYLPRKKSVFLRKQRLARVLGHHIADEEVALILKRLGMNVTANQEGWDAEIPSYRFDISIEEDLIEEVGRVFGYDKVPNKKIVAKLDAVFNSESVLTLRDVRNCLVDRDYYEVITYSFVDPKIQALLQSPTKGYRLLNPISEELSEMRQSLLPGLISTLIYNNNRQQSRIRLFESGLRFIKNSDELLQELVIGGIVTGSVFPEQWGVKNRSTDFFDVKGDVEALIALTNDASSFHFEPLTDSPLLHPGQSAVLRRGQKIIGQIGVLHPQIMQKLGLCGQIVVFEILFNELAPAKLPTFATLSKYPAIRRDIAILVDSQIPAEKLCESIKESVGSLLIDLKIFDVYQGNKDKDGKISIAFGLLLQHKERTLIDEEVNQAIERVVTNLGNEFKAVLRN